MNYHLANFSTDLRRISNWFYYGEVDLVNRVLEKSKDIYKINKQQGPYKDIWIEIEKIKLQEGGRMKAADRATTLSLILLHESLK
jgi:hypothetical protein